VFFSSSKHLTSLATLAQMTNYIIKCFIFHYLVKVLNLSYLPFTFAILITQNALKLCYFLFCLLHMGWDALCRQGCHVVVLDYPDQLPPVYFTHHSVFTAIF